VCVGGGGQRKPSVEGKIFERGRGWLNNHRSILIQLIR
jgi:hypothetical protein